MISIFLIAIVLLIFMHYENDHKDCKNSTEYSVLKDGTKIRTEKHICNERLNF